MKSISAKELCALLKEHRQNPKTDIFIDVRYRDEYAKENIPGVMNIPINELEAHVKELKDFDNIYVHCQKGGRSAMACEMLDEIGFDNVFNVEGGLDAWKECQIP